MFLFRKYAMVIVSLLNIKITLTKTITSEEFQLTLDIVNRQIHLLTDMRMSYSVVATLSARPSSQFTTNNGS